MLGSDVLEVAIGVTLLFLLMSLICTAIREAIEGFLKTRAKDLEQGIREILNDPDGTGLAEQFFDHPMIYSLFAGDYNPRLLKNNATSGPSAGGPSTDVDERRRFPLRAARNLPSYIPSGHFAVALMDLVVRGAVPQTADPNAPSSVISIDNLRASAAKIQNARVQRALLSAIDTAQGDLGAVQNNLETWYNGTMDRVSGWYKRRTQMILFGLGLAATVVLNVDAITIAQRLTIDKNLRQAAVAQAEAIVGGLGTNSGSPEDATKLDNLRSKSYSSLAKNLQNIGYPIGWVQDSGVVWPEPQFCARDASDSLRCKFNVGGFIQTLVGWFVTALAIMLGAPFWFDVLNKFMVVRSTVKPHEKSPEEASEDRQDSTPPAVSPPTRAPATQADGADRVIPS